jgi:hypothetical protein
MYEYIVEFGFRQQTEITTATATVTPTPLTAATRRYACVRCAMCDLRLS